MSGQTRSDQVRPGHRQCSHCQGNNYMCPVKLYDCTGVTFDFEILAVWVTFSFEKNILASDEDFFSLRFFISKCTYSGEFISNLV